MTTPTNDLNTLLAAFLFRLYERIEDYQEKSLTSAFFLGKCDEVKKIAEELDRMLANGQPVAATQEKP